MSIYTKEEECLSRPEIQILVKFHFNPGSLNRLYKHSSDTLHLRIKEFEHYLLSKKLLVFDDNTGKYKTSDSGLEILKKELKKEFFEIPKKEEIKQLLNYLNYDDYLNLKGLNKYSHFLYFEDSRIDMTPFTSEYRAIYILNALGYKILEEIKKMDSEEIKKLKYKDYKIIINKKKRVCTRVCYKGEKRQHDCDKPIFKKNICYYHFKKSYPHLIGRRRIKLS